MAKSFLDLFQFASSVTESVKNTFITQLWTIHYWKVGKSLLTAMTDKAGGLWTTTVDVDYTPGAFAYKDSDRLYFDPEYVTKSPYFEPTQGIVVASGKTYVYLFHELVHFYHKLAGGFRADTEEEFRTTGLYEYSGEAYSENALRSEASLPRRPCYFYSRRADNLAGYQEEERKRNQRGLPSQSQLNVSSGECRFPYKDPGITPPGKSGHLLRKTPGITCFAQGQASGKHTRRGPLGHV